MTDQEYLEKQIAWRFFERVVENKQMQTKNGEMCVKDIEMRIQIEILKELQYLNSKQ